MSRIGRQDIRPAPDQLLALAAAALIFCMTSFRLRVAGVWRGGMREGLQPLRDI
jgi:hypothetical protein